MGHISEICVLCSDLITDRSKTWLDEFPTVYTKDKQWNSPRLSGIGAKSDSVFTVPLEADQRHDDVGLDPLAVTDLQMLESPFDKSLQEIFQQRLKETGGFNKKNDAGEAAWTRETTPKVSNSTDCFQFFPAEIIYGILIFLPSKDVLNAKLASATFAALPLGNAFWASRFRRGFEFHCVFEAQGLQTKDCDWEAIYVGVKNLQNDIQDNLTFQNRRRIWKLLLVIEELHSRLVSTDLKGTLLQSFFEPDAPEDKRSWKMASAVLNKADINFRYGCRSLFERTIDITFKIAGVFLTFVRFNGIRYVSGIRFQQYNGVNSSLGYVVSNEEIEMGTGSLLSKDGCRISGLYLAIDFRGVRALSLLTSTGKLSTWVGEHYGIPKTRLLLNHGDSLSLKAGFNVMISPRQAYQISETMLDGCQMCPTRPYT
ncbi:hypothetical protein VE03_07861 [Pseudogymnoascus sp. 23342-1-I1]|nr:hypothetical protein VE03_07861 [Pseudogymnoascus sp. 23342-1-I1]